jgi:hypothetical protein
MPWCEECAKYWAPSAMQADGSCPRCGVVIEQGSRKKLTSRQLDLKSLARSTETADDDVDESAPWHFKLLVVALIGYLTWRLVDLFL